tara:strand:- start:711 stop:1847 length:1137 start_codon:yes stop_codon:yes gene_type:complete
MKTIFKLAAVALFLTSCTQDTTYKIEGSLDAENGTAVYLQEIDENNRLATLDTALVENNKFQFAPENVADPKMQLITLEGIPGNIIFIAENEKIEITAYKDSLRASKIEGGSENDYFKKYFDEVTESRSKKQALQREGSNAMRTRDTSKVEKISKDLEAVDKASKESRLALIEEHPNSAVSSIILRDLIGIGLIDSDEAQKSFDNLSQDLRENEMGKEISKFIARLKSQEIASTLASVGNKAPEFSAPTPEGKDLALNEALGKYTIVDFWASWCRPCREENPNVVRVYKKFHDKGLNIISVSLDRPKERERWIQAIENDEMDWFHVSNLQYWQDPIVRKYGITGIPATFLLDENGVIIDKNLRGEALEEKMESLLGES